ncbi:dephospho-CoA kinase [Rhodothalassium salexigens]|uniref:dephospho-CoA kinase n=1 Tax=Rhodothalassium salexigens TaxID=1086 RepID=UPI0019112819|nr:dephospho-CoA kinase [Rhodothalassium salexigens]MBK5911526.1 dephospho-CoA kinase [Rhodothalassium salexigens]MBK5921352.1 dephospho-CoA kinase [Rhodothalassium salexigens]
MLVIGLTGSIGMGKSTAARMFRRLGVPVFDSDACVHALMRPGQAGYRAIAGAFPEAVGPGGVDRAALGARVFGDPGAKARLEALLHPLVFADQRAFLARQQRARARHVVLDIPLLFETGGAHRVDCVAVVSAPYAIQARRVLARPGMTADRFRAILAAQMPDAEKRRRADVVIPSGHGHRPALRAILALLRSWPAARGRVWRPGWGGPAIGPAASDEE